MALATYPANDLPPAPSEALRGPLGPGQACVFPAEAGSPSNDRPSAGTRGTAFLDGARKAARAGARAADLGVKPMRPGSKSGATTTTEGTSTAGASFMSQVPRPVVPGADDLTW